MRPTSQVPSTLTGPATSPTPTTLCRRRSHRRNVSRISWDLSASATIPESWYTITRVASSPHASGGLLLTTVTTGSSYSTAAGRSGRPRTVRPPPKSPNRNRPSSPPNLGAVGARTPNAFSPPARVATLSFSMRATRGSTPVLWREGRDGQGVYQGPPTSTPTASSTSRAVLSTPMRNWRGG